MFKSAVQQTVLGQYTDTTILGTSVALFYLFLFPFDMCNLRWDCSQHAVSKWCTHSNWTQLVHFARGTTVFGTGRDVVNIVAQYEFWYVTHLTFIFVFVFILFPTRFLLLSCHDLCDNVVVTSLL